MFRLGMGAYMKVQRRCVSLLGLLLALLLIAAGFCACNGATVENPPDLTRGFTCNADIKYGDVVLSAGINRVGSGAWDVEVMEPASLKGMKLTYQNGDVSVSYLGMTITLPEDSLPVKTAAGLLFDALDNAAEGTGTSFTQNGDTISVNGSTGDNKYALTLDKKSGALLSFSMPNFALDAAFKDFVYGEKPKDTESSSNSAA